jgi:hypothetical protein
MCIDYFNFTPIPSTAVPGTVAPVDLSNSTARVHALAMYVLLNSNTTHTSSNIDNNPLTPLNGDAVKFWQYVAWEATTSLTPDFTALLPTLSGPGNVLVSSDALTAPLQFALGSLTLPQYLAGGVGGVGQFSSFLSGLSYFSPSDKHNQRFLVWDPARNSTTADAPEPGMLGMISGAGVLLAIGVTRGRGPRAGVPFRLG